MSLEVNTRVFSDAKSVIWDFSFSSWERQQNLALINFCAALDVSRDGEADYTLFIGNAFDFQAFAENSLMWPRQIC